MPKLTKAQKELKAALLVGVGSGGGKNGPYKVREPKRYVIVRREG